MCHKSEAVLSGRVLVLAIVTGILFTAPVFGGPVLVIDDSSSGSAAVIAGHLNTLGIFVIQEDATVTDPLSWPGYDFIVWSCGDGLSPLNQLIWRTDLEGYVTAGNALWIEGGEVAFTHEFETAFASNVLFMDTWHYLEPAGDIIFFEGGHAIVTVPNMLSSPITHTYTYWGDQDSTAAAANAEEIASWSLETGNFGSIIAHDDDSDPLNGGQIVFTCFNYNAMDAVAQAPMAENIAAYLTGGAPTPTPTDTPSFPTATPRPRYCNTPNAAIPDYQETPVPLHDFIIITETGTISDLDISVIVNHTWVGDIIMTLEHMDTGTVVTFIDRPGEPAGTNGCREDNIDATLDDDASDPVEDECSSVNPAAIYGTFFPNNFLSAFNSEDLYGIWRLSVTDNYYGDTGSLVEWCMIASLAGDVTPTPTGPPPAIPATSPGGVGILLIILGALMAGTLFKRRLVR